MKKYKIKQNYYCVEWSIRKAWDEFEWDENHLFILHLLNIWFIEEVKEDSPKFKVWDYAVFDLDKWHAYIKITEIRIEWSPFTKNIIKYNRDSTWWYYEESELRKPTSEELEKYFR